MPGGLRDPLLVDPDELLDELEQAVAAERLRARAPRVSQARPGPATRGGRGRRTGSAIRSALVFIRRMFMSGRKSVTLPFASR